MRVLASELAEYAGQPVTVAGWLHRRRQLKSVSFVILRDRTGLIQVVTNNEDVMVQIADLSEETVLEITGTATANPQAPGGVEITSPTISVLSSLSEPPPFELYRPVVNATLPVILDSAPVSLRHPKLRGPFEIAAVSARRAARPWRRRGSPRSSPRRSLAPPPSPGRMFSPSTTSAVPRTWPSRRSSTSRRW